jgi:hypothetical protein
MYFAGIDIGIEYIAAKPLSDEFGLRAKANEEYPVGEEGLF